MTIHTIKHAISECDQLSSEGRSEGQTFGTTSSMSSADVKGKESRFDAGMITVRGLVLLMWLHAGIRVYKLVDLFQLLTKTRDKLAKASPAFSPSSEGIVVVNWVIVLLSLNVAFTVGTFATVLYASATYLCQYQTPVMPKKRTKATLRTIGTVHFYLALLPDSLVTLVVSERVSVLSHRIGRRLRQSELSVEAVKQLKQNFGCPATNCTSLGHTWDGAEEFFDPMRRHLKLAYVLEAWFQMTLILLAFLVSHLIRTRRPRELNHRSLLLKSSYCRDVLMRDFLAGTPHQMDSPQQVGGSQELDAEMKKVV